MWIKLFPAVLSSSIVQICGKTGRRYDKQENLF